MRTPQHQLYSRIFILTFGLCLVLKLVLRRYFFVIKLLAPQDIDQLQLGQTANLRFSAFNQRTTPEINGRLSRISADVSVDERSGENYYTARITMSPEDVAGLGDVTLVPGMPVEVFIKTGDRRVISYLVKPMSDQIMRAFRESE